MLSVEYEFTRDTGRNGFFRTNRSSTDARGLLLEWQAGHPDRSYEIFFDEDSQTGNQSDVLQARLSSTERDPNLDGSLDELCQKHGLTRRRDFTRRGAR
jgi:hypothetical protein